MQRTITFLVVLIVIFAAFTSSIGIFSKSGSGSFEYKTIRGETVEIYGRGIYRHMSADVAIQGIAQDYVTLFIGIPLLLIALVGWRRNSFRCHFLLSGTLGYFFVTFLFYTAMGMYNYLFLAYVALLALSFFALLNSLLKFELGSLKQQFGDRTPVKLVGGFLIVNAICIGLMWLGIVVPPLLDGSIYPESLQHYTTLIVQGFDLGLLLPLAFVSGLLFIQKKPLGYLAVPTYIIFLSILMTALTAKLIAMAMSGVNVIPAIFIIPAFNLFTIFCAVITIRNMKK